MKKISIYTDSSGGRKIVGLGAVVKIGGSEFPMGTAFKPGCKTTEAEILALMHGLDLFRTIAKTQKLVPQNTFITFLSDCQSAVNAVNGVVTLRGDARSLVKNFVEELIVAVGKEISGWTINHIPRNLNKADQVAKRSRSLWMRRFRPKSSGPS
jgi:ribonuclease HI